MGENALRLYARVELAWINKGVTFDTNGHKVNEPYLLIALKELDETTLRNLLYAIENQAPLSDFVLLRGSVLNACFTCGEESDFETNGLVLRAKNTCPYPNGIPLTFELNVPSGVMIVANDLRSHFDFAGDYNVNTAIGCVKTTKAMEAVGCAHAAVGNSCPGVYKTGEDTFVIARVGYDEKTNKEIEPKGVRVAGIVTDLWWYSIVDADEFEKRGCEGQYDDDRVEVRPGVYRFTHLTHLHHEENDYSEPFIYTSIEWVRPPDPVRDYQAESANKNFTAGQVIYNSMQTYPTLYDGEDAVQKAADHIFCVYGGGGDWHPNGFVQYDPDMSPDAPEIDIPVFDKAYRWYPLSEHSALCRAAGIGDYAIHLNPSFLALALNIIHCILTHGSESLHPDIHDNNQEIARKCLEGLNKRYPLAKLD